MKPVLWWRNYGRSFQHWWQWEKRKCRKIHFNTSKLFYTYPFLQESTRKRSPTLVPHHNKGFINQFLKGLGCHKLCWDQARLSSLVSKQVACQNSSRRFQQFFLHLLTKGRKLIAYSQKVNNNFLHTSIGRIITYLVARRTVLIQNLLSYQIPGRFHVKGPRKKVNVKKWIFLMKCER